MDATENLKRVQSTTFIKSITEEAVEAFCRDFEFVEGMIIGADEARGKVNIDEKESEAGAESEKGVEDEKADWSLRALFPRTTGEIRVLLS
ncbi:Conserved oligomeric complex COG6 [Aspergillus sclerotialis]|uniref:Conserved oligomeric complex COG6 n=1 Tax=Aspergillus sclerotialis TaxID=2070753 RepID=A0A3A3A6G2_9EURO|nr:Conserved oligomeric complex COG6 [Aspergillus sclerotialis]